MKRVEITLSLPVVRPLLEVVKELIGSLKRSLAVTPSLPDIDAEFRDAWTGELLAAQRQDLNTLLALFGEDFFTEGVVAFDPNNAEGILRACAAVRLRLRTRYLEALGDEALEAGEIDVKNLPDAQRKAFLCYIFLATIQELIIQHLDTSIVG